VYIVHPGKLALPLHCGNGCHSYHAPGNAALAGLMSSNRLRLNAQTTKFIWLGAKQQLAKLNLDTLSAEFPTMSFSPAVCDLGVLLGSELTFSHHRDQVCSRCYYQLKQLMVTARSLTFNAAVSLLCSAALTIADRALGVTVFVWLGALLSARALPLSFLVQAVVHCGPLYAVIWWSHSPALRQCRPVLFLWLVQQPGMDFQ